MHTVRLIWEEWDTNQVPKIYKEGPPIESGDFLLTHLL